MKTNNNDVESVKEL